MHDLTEVSHSSSLATSNSLSTNNLLSPLFTALGWKDLKPAIVAAEQADQALTVELQQAYDAYSKTPDDASKRRLQMVLDQTIGELQADLARVKKLEKEAAKRLAKPQTSSSGYLASWGSWVKQSAQAFFGSDDASLVERYSEIAQKREQDIAQLSRLRAGLSAKPHTQHAARIDTPATMPADSVSAMGRRLLATENPVVISPQQYCPPSGSCDLSNLRDGTSGFVLQGEAADDYSGYSVSSAGDINGDSVDDVIIGVPYADLSNNRTDAGKVYVVFGSSGNTAWSNGTLDLYALMDSHRGFMLQGEASGDLLGYSVSSAGDINGDGVEDLVIGASQGKAAYPYQPGKSYIVFGSRNHTVWGNGTLDISALMDGRRGFMLKGERGSDGLMGYSVSSTGDINGDSVTDVIIGAPTAKSNYDVNGIAQGRSYVVFGSSNNTAWGNGTLAISALMDGQRGFVLQGKATQDWSGYSVNSAGDINGDNVDDVIIGAPRADSSNNRTDAGKSYIVFGSSDNTAWGNGTLDISALMDGRRGFALQGELAGDGYNDLGLGFSYILYSVNSGGDVNGDGMTDLVIGVPNAYLNGNDEGKSYVVFGSRNSTTWGNGTLDISALMDGRRGFVLQGGLTEDNSGSSVSSVKDVNGDGVTDLVIGVPEGHSGVGRSWAGKSYVVFGSRNSTTWSNGTLELSSLGDGRRGFALQGEASYDNSGHSVSSAGDVNGDGVVDLVVGALYADSNNNRTNAGKSYVVFGAGPPLQWANELTVYNGLTTRLNSQNLNVTHNTPVLFNVTSITHGRFEYITKPGQAIRLFNQSDVWGGQIQFVHTTPSVAPSYSLQVVSTSRLIPSFMPQNATITFYQYMTTNTLAIHEGETLRVSRLFLDAYSNYTAEQVTFTISNLQHGQFFLESLNNSVTQFNQANILAGQVLFAHDNSRIAPSYRVEISDPSNILLPANPSTVTFYRRPAWVTNQLALTQGETVVFNASHVNTTADVPANQVLFTISGLQHGQFLLTTSNSSIMSFTQQQLLAKQVSFRHDTTDTAPSYQLQLSDGYFMLAPEAAQVTFTRLPPVLMNNSLTVYQGRNHTLTADNLYATDPNPIFNASQVLFIVSDVQHGQFRLQGVTGTIMQFFQAHIARGQVVFTHDDSTTAPSYRVVVSNTYQSTTPSLATISFNKRPSVINNRLTLKTGGSVVLALTNLQAVDDHTPSSELLFVVNEVKHGYFSELQNLGVAITQFPQQRVRDSEIQFQHDGSGNAPSYTIKVIDSSGLESNQTGAKIDFENTLASDEIDWKALYASVSTIGGVILSVGGYFWLRHRTASHRQGYEFANALRTAANLQYHDFMRFKGDIYTHSVLNLGI